jgi:transcriptional regulator with XRE-family HTH domain
MTIADNLKKLRKEKKYTQAEVANFIGITRPSYTNFEISRIPDIDVLWKIADLYQISIDDLVGRGKQENSSVVTDEDKKLLWQSEIRSRKTDELIMFMLFLLKITNSDKIKVAAERAIQRIANFVIKNAYSYLQRNIPALRDETNNLYSFINTDIRQISDEVWYRFRELKDDIDYDPFSSTELLDPDIVNRYFHINVKQILNSEPNFLEVQEAIRQVEITTPNENGSVGV